MSIVGVGVVRLTYAGLHNHPHNIPCTPQNADSSSSSSSCGTGNESSKLVEGVEDGAAALRGVFLGSRAAPWHAEDGVTVLNARDDAGCVVHGRAVTVDKESMSALGGRNRIDVVVGGVHCCYVSKAAENYGSATAAFFVCSSLIGFTCLDLVNFGVLLFLRVNDQISLLVHCYTYIYIIQRQSTENQKTETIAMICHEYNVFITHSQ